MSYATIFFFIVVLYSLLNDFVKSESLEIVKYALLRGTSLVALMAFHSVRIQMLGLIGTNGLIPINSTLLKLKEFSNRSANMFNEPVKFCMKHLLSLVYQKFHTTKDVNAHLVRICNIDLIISVVAFIYPHPVLFVYLYFSYYSYKRVMDRFLNYQWDALLLETLLIGTVLSLSFDSITTAFGVWQYKILLFRLMFGSGVVKYYGRDESWHTSYTAMCYHFLTQPLPSTLGMYIHTHSPAWLLKSMTVGTLVVELALPALSLLNIAVTNWLVAVSYIGLQISIGVSGYYGFFGTLTSVLSISLFNDWFLVQAISLCSFSCLSVDDITSALVPSSRTFTLLSLVSTALSSIVIYPLFVVVTVVQMSAIHSLLQYIPFFKSDSKKGSSDEDTESSEDKPESTLSVKAVAEAVDKLHHFTMMTLFLGCHYGLFASMTKVRNEFTISLSADKEVWHEVDFAFKPGSEYLPPKSVTSASVSSGSSLGCCYYHMPRLDWSMWFLPFSSNKAAYPRWLWVLLISILEGNKDVMNLFGLKNNWTTFSPDTADVKADSEPQRILYDGVRMQYIRVQLINYTYADPKVVIEEKKYWKTQYVREVVQPSKVEDLYELLDAYDKMIYGADQSAKPKAETAQEMIARMLRLAQKKKSQKEEKQS